MNFAQESFATRYVTRAFTLIELLVTVSVIAILVSILLPSLGAARRSAQAVNSATNLNAMGRSLLMHAEEDSEGRMCTGSFDHIRDGDVRVHGWVEDMVSMGVINPGRALDPSNPSRVSRTVAEYTGMLTEEFDHVEPDYHWADQAEALSGVLSSDEAIEALDKGYNTNYLATWYLIRGDPVNSNYSPYKDAADAAGGTPDDGLGPMSIDDLANAATNIHNIPLMSEARNNTSAFQSTASEWTGSGSTVVNALSSIGIENAEQGMTANTTTGMTAYTGSDAHPGVAGDRGTGTASSAGEAWEHDFGNMWPKHFAKRTTQTLPEGDVLINWLVDGYANVLFSDGHVAKVKDTEGINERPDGFLGAYPSTIRNGNFVDYKAGGENTLWSKRIVVE